MASAIGRTFCLGATGMIQGCESYALGGEGNSRMNRGAVHGHNDEIADVRVIISRVKLNESRNC
jgi:hypothetical protein